MWKSARLNQLLAALCLLLASPGSAKINVTFSPSPIIIKTEANSRINLTFSASEPVPAGIIRLATKEPKVAILPNANQTLLTLPDDLLALDNPVEVTIRGVRLGWTDLTLKFESNSTNASSSDVLLVTKVQIAVLRDQTVVQLIYRYILIVCVVILTIGMGCTIDIHVVFKLLKRPVALFVGWCAQFFLMPHLGLAVGQVLLLLVTDLDNVNAFAYGILTLACAPGGGGSNVWTLLFDGDLDLSMTMTFVSQLCALFMMPLWLFAYSRFYVDVNTVRVPFDQVALNLLQLVFPVLFGVLLKAKWPNVARKVAQWVKPFTLFFILFIIGFGTYVNFFLFELIGQLPIIIPFAALLPWLGFLSSYIVTQLLRVGRRQAIAIALETGIQNIGIPILVLQFSMPKPDGDLAAIVPLIVALVTPIPLYIMLGIKRLRERLRRKNNYPMGEADNPAAAGDAGVDGGVDSTAYSKAVDYKAEDMKSGHTVDMSEYAQIQFNRQKSTDYLTAD